MTQDEVRQNPIKAAFGIRQSGHCTCNSVTYSMALGEAQDLNRRVDAGNDHVRFCGALG